MLKKIAITQRIIQNQSYPEQREALDVRWAKLFKELNFLPIVLPIEYDFETYFKHIEIDGILLTGGNDLNIFTASEESLKRDVFEKQLIEYGIKNNIPIFGVCRGMQIIAQYFDSSFKQVSNQVGIRHNLDANKKSKYYNQLSQIKNVNSFHNYAINILSDKLLISATDANGVIKAVEHNTYKIFAQMWHSEREDLMNKAELDLIKRFFK